ncbi:hypothetical protein [Baaleninema simplex]|uniref:hypothetical protein n=1 Tax=Baaleninema simplex TaxID=2862350 RepID=UPI000345716D|nr:hypothetical protein [Baaleninema simplex]
MSSPPRRSRDPKFPQHLNLSVDPSHPRFLDGLDAWLELGLIADEQVKFLAQRYLSSVLPEPTRPPIPKPLVPSPTPQLTPTPRKPSRLSQWSEALKEELSVRWLLWLGVFVVLVSSGLLAASQWERFPASGQYGVLWGYTMLFWLASRWTQPRAKLRLTAQTLQIVALCLIPLNFWAMDEFTLWQTLLGMGTMAIATLSLGAIALASQGRDRIDTVLLLLLSVLHGGTHLLGVPVAAAYVGTGIWILTAGWQTTRNPSPGLLLFALATLFVRALPELNALGLALGLVGWRLMELPNLPKRGLVGGIVMAAGFAASVVSQPWQALGVVVSALHRLFDRLCRFGRHRHLAMLFGIGLVGYGLAGSMFPPEATKPLLDGLGISGATFASIGVAGFPYLWAMLGITAWLRRRDSVRDTELAKFGDVLALGWGTFLVAIGVAHPGVRAIALILSASTLGIVTHRRYPVQQLAYITQGLGIAGLASLLYWKIPTLSLWDWGEIALVATLLEWLGANLPPHRTASASSSLKTLWQTSAWYAGYVLGSFSFLVFLAATELVLPSLWVLWWWAIPVVLTAIAQFGSPRYRILAARSSIGGAIAAQALTYRVPGLRLVSLGIAAILMLVNVRVLKRSNPATVAVGFGVVLTVLTLWEAFPLTFDGWLVVGAIVPLALWGLWRWRDLRGGGLSALYLPGTDAWAMGLCVLELFVLTLHSFLVYQRWAVEPSVWAILASAVTVGAIAFRQIPYLSNWGLYGLAWGLEVLVVETLGVLNPSWFALAVANIGLGLLSQVFGDWWLRRHGDRDRLYSFYAIPILYGIAATLFRSTQFGPQTGLITLGFSVVLLGLGRREATFQPLVYLGLAGVSASAYELLGAQLGGLATGDRWVSAAALSVGILTLYRRLLPQLARYFGLVPGTVQLFAHSHWLIGTVSLATAAAFPVKLPWLALGAGIVLTRYALVQGRQPNRLEIAELWVYLGVLQGLGILTFAVVSLGWHNFLLPWYGAIAALLAYFFRILPWQSWGWPNRPWYRVSRGLPLVVAWVTIETIHPVSLGAIALFYGVLAILERSLRWSYIGIGVSNVLLFRGFRVWDVENLLAWTTPPMLSFLYLAAFDPAFRQGKQRSLRHLFRIVTLAVFFAAAYESTPWLVVAALSLGCLLLGAILRVRAFLFVGTAVFAIAIFHQLVLLGAMYSFSKWLGGLAFGLILIWVAATFEARREQIVSALQNWLAVLESWE